VGKLSSEEIKSFYNNKYVNKLSRQTIYKNRRLLKYILFEKTDVVVDFGCGDGRFAHLIYEYINNYIGVDFSNDFIEIAKNNLLQTNINNACFICEDIILFCKKNPNTFDKAFAFDFTEHIYDEELIMILSAIRYSLKVNGILFIHTPNGDYFIEKFKKAGIINQFPEHIAVRNNEENIEIFKKAGFSRITVKFISHYVKILGILHFLSYIPIFGKYFKARIFISAQFI
jgi:SAM-dependent methyltransferase